MATIGAGGVSVPSQTKSIDSLSLTSICKIYQQDQIKQLHKDMKSPNEQRQQLIKCDIYEFCMNLHITLQSRVRSSTSAISLKNDGTFKAVKKINKHTKPSKSYSLIFNSSKSTFHNFSPQNQCLKAK